MAIFKKLFSQYSFLLTSGRQLIEELSGGNQQKLVFAREISNQPSILVISQPTRGVDLNGIKAIHNLIIDFASQGGAVLMTSEELEELQLLKMVGG